MANVRTLPSGWGKQTKGKSGNIWKEKNKQSAVVKNMPDQSEEVKEILEYSVEESGNNEASVTLDVTEKSSQDFKLDVPIKEEIYDIELSCTEKEEEVVDESQEIVEYESDNIYEFTANDLEEKIELESHSIIDSEDSEIELSFEGIVDKYSLGLSSKPKKKK